MSNNYESIQHSPKKSQTFGRQVIDFYNNIKAPNVKKFGVEIINPHQSNQTRACVDSFYQKYYNDNSERIFVFGINPGRFGSGVTGVPFTDPIALEDYCDIENNLQKRKELSSDFVYQCINAFGGSQEFFKSFYLTAVSPIGFSRKSKNYNYYDDKDFLQHIRQFLITTIKNQIDFGANRNSVVILGSGKNLKNFESINEELNFFQTVHVLEHPRYIMQYKRKNIDEYITKYIRVFKKCLK